MQTARVRVRELTRRKVGRSLLAGSVCLVVVGLLVSVQSGEEGTSSDPKWCGVTPAFLLDPLEDCSPGRLNVAFWLILAGLTLTAVSLLVFFPTVDQDHRSERIAFRWTRSLFVLTPGLLLLPVTMGVYQSDPTPLRPELPPVVPEESARWQSLPEACFLVPWAKQLSLLGEDTAIADVRQYTDAQPELSQGCRWKFEDETSDEMAELVVLSTLHRDAGIARSEGCPPDWERERGNDQRLLCRAPSVEIGKGSRGAIVVDNLVVTVDLTTTEPNQHSILEDLLDLVGSEVQPA